MGNSALHHRLCQAPTATAAASLLLPLMKRHTNTAVTLGKGAWVVHVWKLRVAWGITLSHARNVYNCMLCVTGWTASTAVVLYVVETPRRVRVKNRSKSPDSGL